MPLRTHTVSAVLVQYSEWSNTQTVTPGGGGGPPAGERVLVDWEVDLLDNSGAQLVTDLPFKDLQVTWTLDGPGSAEITLTEDDTATQWIPGKRRVLLKRDGVTKFGGWLSNVREQGSGSENLNNLNCGVLGLADILDYRVVHGDFNETAVVSTLIVWHLIQHAQAQTGGDVGFTNGTTLGTSIARDRKFCDGDVIGEAIKDLAAKANGGFDWEISPTGVLNMWVGGRGTDLSGAITLLRTQTLDWSVDSETSDMATYVTAMGEDPDGPCGPPLTVQNLDLSGYVRREVVVDSDSKTVTDLEDTAIEELRARQRARLRVTVQFDLPGLPWGWDSVWLGDKINIGLDARYGGTQKMKCIEINVSLEKGQTEWLSYTFEAA